MKKYYLALAAVAVIVASCSKEEVVTPAIQEEDSHLVQMSFTATTVDTKTSLGALSEGQYPVVWSDSDEIKVIAVDGEGATLHTDTFTIDAGGSSTATFTGTTYAEAAAYYAVYPASFTPTVSGTGTSATIALSDYKNHNVTAVAGGYDPTRAVMFAVSDDGAFTFKHGVSFFKITIGIDDVSSVEFRVPSSDGGARIFGNPTYKVSDGTTSAYNGADKSNNYVTLAPTSGTLTKGATYYVPFAAKASSLTTYLQLTYTVGGETASKKTTKLNGTFANGHVYDLGTPPISFGPSFSASNVNIEADDEAGTIDFTVSKLVDGGVVTKEVLAGATISNLTLGAVSFNTSTGVGSVGFTCDENADTVNPKTATVRLTYTYNTDQTVTKDVTITQKKASSGGSVDYVWDFASTEWQDALEDQAVAAKGTNNSSWSVTYDDLTFTAGGSNAKWDPTYITTGGNGSKTKRVFTFTATVAGTLSVWSSNTSNSEDTSRKVNVVVGTGDVDTQDGGAASSSPAQLDFDIAAGDVYIYTTNSLRIYKIEFHE